MFCPNCGKQIPDGSKFCPVCGGTIAAQQNNAGTVGQQQQPYGNSQQQGRQPYGNPQQQGRQPYGNPQQQGNQYYQGQNPGGKPPQKKSLLWLWILLGVLALMIIIVAVVLIAGGSSTGNTDVNAANTTVTDNATTSVADTTIKQTGIFDEATVISQLTVTQYTMAQDSGYYYVLLVVKNNSEFDINIDADMNFYDSGKNVIGTSSSTVYSLHSGSENVLEFSNEAVASSVDYEFSVDESNDKSGTQYMTCKTNNLEDKCVVSLTNNGTEEIKYACANVLFFKGDKLVSFSSVYCTNDSSVLPAGKTINKDISIYDEYDSVKVYLEGYIDNY